MAQPDIVSEKKGLIYNIQRYSTEDGPGLRTTVFFKGCPLRCPWCSNPESIQHQPQMMFFPMTCAQCYTCMEACPNGANKKLEDGSVFVDRSICKNCGACIDVCPADARSMAGKWMTVDEVFDIIEKDSVYYANSNGGVTFGGGECTAQADFLMELIDKCYNWGYHTCVDTCGFTSWDTLEKILQKVDMVLFDLKHMDPEKHKEITGVDNKLILENAAKIKNMGIEMHLRFPMIPGYNDDEKNIKAMGRFMKLWGLEKIDILPYHRMGVNKYEALGQRYLLGDLPSLEKENVKDALKILESYDLDVDIV
ncbi:MAG: glycyl-radical enzyme activating protein [Dehalobacterium sp.]|jgi:glycyl-radical enzyme activating protein